MKRLLTLAGLLLAAPLAAQPAGVPPSLKAERIAPVIDPTAIPLYPGMKQGRVIERWDRMFDGQRAVRNVTQPTLTPVLPDPAKATGAAVIIIPGGGFQFISMDNEGWPVARWLADHGIAAFILKYRTNETEDDEAAMEARMARIFADAARAGPKATPRLEEPRATEDALAALRMVRARAAEWHVDPARLGAIGFSAGAMTSINAALTADAAARPAFFGYIYGPMLPVAVPTDAPPMFAALALDDPLFGGQGLGIIDAWRLARRPVELHAYQKGSHGFGMGRPGTTTTLMLDQFRLWLETNGWLAK